MAVRIVLLGWAGRALELNAMDASAMVDTGMCRVCLTQYSGPLRNATVLMFRPEYLMKTGHQQDSEAAYEVAWANAKALPLRDAREFVIRVPVPVGRSER